MRSNCEQQCTNAIRSQSQMLSPQQSVKIQTEQTESYKPHKGHIHTESIKDRSAPATINRSVNNDDTEGFRHTTCNGVSPALFLTLRTSCHCKPAKTNQQLLLTIQSKYNLCYPFSTKQLTAYSEKRLATVSYGHKTTKNISEFSKFFHFL